MLATVTGILRERGLLAPDEEPGYNVTAVSADVMNIGAHTRDAFFHVKVKKSGVLPAEYANYCSAWRSFPRYVPEPLGCYAKHGREIIVFRGVRHRPVRVGSIARDQHRVAGKIIGFLKASAQGATVGHPGAAHRAFLRALQERTADPISSGILGTWTGAPRLDDLPHIIQHGDFVVNNLGLAGSGLVVFDWEDFGRVSFPGLDLCTLLASDTRFNAERLRDLIRGDTRAAPRYSDLLHEACAVLGLTPKFFRQLIPLYLVIFLDLKRDYGAAIRDLLGQTLSELQQLIETH